jgi:hypothetical protein
MMHANAVRRTDRWLRAVLLELWRAILPDHVPLCLGADEYVLAYQQLWIVVQDTHGNNVHSLARIAVGCVRAAHATE